MAFFLKDKHIIINYHYVREKGDLSAIYPCSPEEFERQVKFLSANYQLSPIENVFHAAIAGSKNRMCALTLDDGTKDNYEIAIPILKRYQAVATFFIITGVFDAIMPYTHKIHILLSRFDIGELIDSFNNFLIRNYPDMIEKFFIPKDKRLANTKRHDYGGDFRIDNFKEKITSAPKDLRNDFIADFFDKTGLSEKEMIKEFFMNENEVKDLHKQGFLIGQHTHSHNAVDTLRPEEMQKELNSSQKWFERVINKNPDFFSYPYGRSCELAIKILKDNNINYAVTIERRPVLSGDNPLKIPRYDTNDIRDFLNQNNL